jgi:hypothetical protein
MRSIDVLSNAQELILIERKVLDTAITWARAEALNHFGSAKEEHLKACNSYREFIMKHGKQGLR